MSIRLRSGSPYLPTGCPLFIIPLMRTIIALKPRPVPHNKAQGERSEPENAPRAENHDMRNAGAERVNL